MMDLDSLPPFDIPPQGVTELYTRMGRALWFCQCLEEMLAYYLCLRYEIPPGTAEEIALEALDQKLRKTLGQLVSDFAKKNDPSIPDEIDQRLREFKGERNWLAHRVQGENHTDLYHGDRFNGLLLRLEAVKREAQSLTKVFGGLLDDWAETQGLSQEELAKRMAQVMNEWKAT